MKKLSLFMIICLIGFPQISETIYTPSLPDVAKFFCVSAFAAELTLGVYFVGFSLGVMLWGIIADLYGRRPALLFGLISYILGSFGCMYSPSIDAFFFFRIVQAFGASAGSVVTMTIIRDQYLGKDKERAKLFASVGAALALSPALGPVIGGYVDEYFFWQANFLVLVLIGSALLLWSLFCLPETRPADLVRMELKGLFRLFIQMLQDRHIIFCSLLIGACNGILFSYYQEAPFIFIEHLNLSSGEYGLLGVVVALATFGAALFSRYLLRFYVAEAVIDIGAKICLLSAAIMSLLAMCGFVEMHYKFLGVLALMAPLFFVLFGVSLIIPNSLSIALKAYGHALGSAGSILGAIYYVQIALMCALMSYLHNGTPQVMPLYFFTLSLLLLYAGKRVVTSQKVSAASGAG